MKGNEGLITEEDINLYRKSEYKIVHIQNVLFQQFEEIQASETTQKILIKAQTVTNFFADPEFHMGNTIWKFNYYIEFCLKWAKREYERSINSNIQTTKYKISEKVFPEEEKEQKTLSNLDITISVHNVLLYTKERDLEKCLLSKHELASRLKSFGKSVGDYSFGHKILSMLKRINSDMKNDLMMTTQLKNMEYKILIPWKLKKNSNIYELMKEYDESQYAIPPISNIRSLTYLDMTLFADSATLMARSFLHPLAFIQTLKLRWMQIIAEFNQTDVDCLKTQKLETLYHYYEIRSPAPDIFRKIYYDCKVEGEKVDINLQGFETFPAMSKVLYIYIYIFYRYIYIYI